VGDFTVGVDLGQSCDSTAVAILQEQQGTPPTFDCVHLERVPLGASYPAVVQRVWQIMQHPTLRGAALAIDSTGVGRPIFDLLQQAGLSPTAITITSGNEVTEKDGRYGVPKRDLIGAAQILVQSHRLRIAKSLPEAETLIKELLNFQIKITVNGGDQYGAWRSGTHDDMVLALSLAAWYATAAPGHISGGWQRFAQAAMVRGGVR
jgi:hypothetical protein